MWSSAKTESRGLQELLWLFTMTVSATWMSSYLLDIDSPSLAWQFCGALQIFAWAVVFLGWRQFRQRRGGQLVLYLLALAVDIMVVGQLRAAWFPCPLRPEVAAYSTLRTAVHARDLPAVEASLARYPVPDFRSEPDSNYCRNDQACDGSLDPLSEAVHLDDVPIATALLKHGAAAGSGGSNEPMAIAATQGSVPMMRLLLHYGASFNYWSVDNSPLWEATASNHPEAVAFLLHLGANPNSSEYDSNGKRQTVLQFAKQQNLTHIVEMMRHSGGKTGKQASKLDSSKASR